MDGAAPGPIGTRDAVIEVAHSVGALVRAVGLLAAGLGKVGEAVRGGSGDPALALAAAEAAAAEAKRTADTSLASVIKGARGDGRSAAVSDSNLIRLTSCGARPSLPAPMMAGCWISA
jgi:hypothetical protein